MNTVSEMLSAHGIAAFETEHYEVAAEYFEQALEQDAHQWQWRWYLAMSYYAQRKYAYAKHHFRFIAEKCPILNMRISALKQLKHTLSREH
jgi:tetratricopeptide (TPR) repeat protein